MDHYTVCYNCLEECVPAVEDKDLVESCTKLKPRCELCKKKGMCSYNLKKNSLKNSESSCAKSKNNDKVKDIIDDVPSKLQCTTEDAKETGSEDTGKISQHNKNDPDALFEVEGILSERKKRGISHLKIKWKGCDQATWEPTARIQKTMNSDVRAFFSSNKKLKSSKLSSPKSDHQKEKVGYKKLGLCDRYYSIFNMLFKIKNVLGDGNCCLYVAKLWLVNNRNMKYTDINKLRHSLYVYVNEKAMDLQSECFGAHKQYSPTMMRSLKNNLWRTNYNFKNGCGKDNWLSMIDIYPVLVHKYGYFKLLVMSDENKSYLYDMNVCEQGFLKALEKKDWVYKFDEPDNEFIRNTMICYYGKNHYQAYIKREH